MRKNIFVLFSVLLMSVSVAFSQKDSLKTELTSIDISSGRSALSNGLSLDFNLAKAGKSYSQITLRQDRIFLNHIYSIPKVRTLIGPSIGYFQNVPFGGVICKFSPFKFFSTLHWVGYSFGEPGGKISLTPQALFLVNAANINVWRFKVNYSAIKFQKLPIKQVVGISYTQKISTNFSVYTDIAYDITNKEQLLKIGIVWKQKK